VLVRRGGWRAEKLIDEAGSDRVSQATVRLLASYCEEVDRCESNAGREQRASWLLLASRKICDRHKYSYLFAPVTKANSWLSLVSQGVNPILVVVLVKNVVLWLKVSQIWGIFLEVVVDLWVASPTELHRPFPK